MKQQWHSGFDDSSGWGRLIDPICLFILSQIAGTIWVIVPREAFAPPVMPNISADINHAEAAGLLKQKAALLKAVNLARQEAATLSLPAPKDVTDKDRLLAQIRTQEEQVKDLEAKLGELAAKEKDLGGKIAAVPVENAQVGGDSEDLRRQLETRQAEVKRLQIKLEQTKGLGGGAGIGSPRVMSTKLTPKFIQLIGDRAVPLDRDHYEIRVGVLPDRKTRAIQYTKKARGESAEELAASASEVSAFLEKMDPSKQYLLCLVSSDSFRIFREVRKLARARGIQVGWDTNSRSDGSLVFGIGNSGEGNMPGPSEP